MNQLIGLVILVLDIIAIVDVVRSSMSTSSKVLWSLGIILFPLIGMILYFVLKNRTPAQAMRS